MIISLFLAPEPVRSITSCKVAQRLAGARGYHEIAAVGIQRILVPHGFAYSFIKRLLGSQTLPVSHFWLDTVI